MLHLFLITMVEWSSHIIGGLLPLALINEEVSLPWLLVHHLSSGGDLNALFESAVRFEFHRVGVI